METALAIILWAVAIVICIVAFCLFVAAGIGLIYLFGTWYDLYKREMEKEDHERKHTDRT